MSKVYITVEEIAKCREYSKAAAEADPTYSQLDKDHQRIYLYRAFAEMMGIVGTHHYLISTGHTCSQLVYSAVIGKPFIPDLIVDDSYFCYVKSTKYYDREIVSHTWIFSLHEIHGSSRDKVIFNDPFGDNNIVSFCMVLNNRVDIFALMPVGILHECNLFEEVPPARYMANSISAVYGWKIPLDHRLPDY